jgi:branched-chain amino acid aminotransferase
VTFERVAMIDGALRAPEEAVVSVWDRGFLYGDGLFESMRTYGARVFAVEEHVARLARGAEAIDLSLPVSQPQLAAEIRAARSASSLVEAAVRLIVTRGVGVPGAAAVAELLPTRVVLVDPLPPQPPFATPGASVISLPAVPAIIPGAKTTSYLPHLLAAARARRQGAIDALMVERDGSVREGATSNVFVVERGDLITPPLDGIVAGITRASVLRAASRIGLLVREESMTIPRLLASDEAFLTSTFRELAPIASLDGRAFGRIERPVTRALFEAFRALAQA